MVAEKKRNRSIADWQGMTDDERRSALDETLEAAHTDAVDFGVYISLAGSIEYPSQTGLLAGIPFSVKDNIDVRGLATTGGTPSLVGSMPHLDSSVVSALRSEGAVPIGKSNLHELCFGTTSNNHFFGPVRNPNDRNRTAGGSSGGSAASVALGTVPFGLGTDTGASVPLPAAFCGVIGFRPSTGRYLGDGVIHLSWTRDAIGIHANTVGDVRLLDRIIARRPGLQAQRSLSGVRLGIPAARHDDLDPEVAEATAIALQRLEKAGVQLVDVEFTEAEQLAAEGFPMVFYETFEGIKEYLGHLSEPYQQLTFDDVARQAGSPDVAGVLNEIAKREVTPKVYAAANDARNRLRAIHQRLFETSGIDGLVYPTVPILPPLLGNDLTVELNGIEHPAFNVYTRNLGAGGLAGAPQITLPVERELGALPVGLTLEGSIGGDELLLELAEPAAIII